MAFLMPDHERFKNKVTEWHEKELMQCRLETRPSAPAEELDGPLEPHDIPLAPLVVPPQHAVPPGWQFKRKMFGLTGGSTFHFELFLLVSGISNQNSSDFSS